MQLTLDHVILRAADPAATLAELADRAGAPILTQVHEVGGLASGIVRAGAIDIEVLRIGAEPPPHPLQLHHNGPAGLRRITFEGDGTAFRLGDVAFEFSSAA